MTEKAWLGGNDLWVPLPTVEQGFAMAFGGVAGLDRKGSLEKAAEIAIQY